MVAVAVAQHSDEPIFNTEAEMAVLGSAILSASKDRLDWFCQNVPPQAFLVDAHRVVAKAIIELHAAGSSVEFLTIKNWLARHGGLDRIGGEDYLIAIGEAVSSAANIEHYARIVMGDAGKREIEQLLKRIQAGCRNGRTVPQILRAIDNGVKHLKFAQMDSDDEEILPLSAYDAETPHWLWEGYIRVGHLNLLEGRGGVSKSTLMLALAMHGSIGKEPLTGRPTEKFKTLYIGRQDSPSEIRGVVEKLGGDASFVFPYDKSLSLDDGGLAWLERTIRRLDVRLVCIDPLKNYFPPSIKSEFDNIALGRFFDGLRSIAQSTQTAIWGVRHFAGATLGKSIENLAAGGQEWRNSARSQLVMLPHPDRKRYPRLVGCFPARGSINAPAGDYFGTDWWNGQFMWVPLEGMHIEAWIEAYPALAAHLGLESEGRRTNTGRPKSDKRVKAEEWLTGKINEFGFASYAEMMKFGAEEDIDRQIFRHAAAALGLEYGETCGMKGYAKKTAKQTDGESCAEVQNTSAHSAQDDFRFES